MLIYIFSFFLTLLLSKKNNLIPATIFFLLMAFRYDIGADFHWYYELAGEKEFYEIPYILKKEQIFEYLNKFGMESFAYIRLEIFNKLLYKFIWKFDLPNQIIMLLYASLIIGIFKKAMDKEKIYSSISWIVFLSFPLFLLNFFSIQRQGVAVLILFYGYQYLKKNNNKFFICIFIASTFHKTAIVGIFIYFISKFKGNFYRYILLGIILIVLKVNFKVLVLNYNIPILSKYKIYIIQKIGSGGEKIFILMLLMLLVLLILALIKEKVYKKNIKLFNIIILGIYIYILFFEYVHFAVRISTYFLIYLIYLIYEYEKKYGKLMKKLTIILSLMLLLITLFVNGGNKKGALVPYKCFISENL